ncbi:MAG: hypothetical protein WDZ37_02555 [Solirubrobacterales bacterium]
MTNAKLGADAVTTDKVAPDTLTADDIANNAVGNATAETGAAEDEIVDGSVDVQDIGANAVDTSEIVANAVGYGDINTNVWGSVNGSASSLPGSGDEGTLFVDDDLNGGTLYRRTGGSWVKIAPGVSEAAADDSWDTVQDRSAVGSDTTTACTEILAGATFAFGEDGCMKRSGTSYVTPNPGSAVFYFDGADYAVSGKTTNFRIRATANTNATAGGQTWTVGMYPATNVAGAADNLTYTLGAAVGNTVAFASPGASTRNQGASTTFSAPANGWYVLGVASSAAMTTSSVTEFDATFQVQVQ